MPIVLSGEEIAQFVKRINQIDSGQQRQPAGFDVTVNKIYSIPKTKYVLGITKTENSILEEVPITSEEMDLEERAYVLELNEITTIPTDAIGILLPRSTLLRNGLDIRSALFDPGYSGQPKVLLVCHRPAKIRRFARIGQLVVIKSGKEFADQYAGRYQSERGLTQEQKDHE